MIHIRKEPRLETLQRLAERYPQLELPAVSTAISAFVLAGEIEAGLEQHFDHYGLSPGRFVVLVTLMQADNHQLTPSELAGRVCVTRGTITGLLNSLQRDGLIERGGRDKADRRVTPIRLTRAGIRLLDSILPDHYARLSALMAGLDPGERATLVRLMGKVRDALPALHRENEA